MNGRWRVRPRRRAGTFPSRPGGPGMLRIEWRSDLKILKIFENLDFLKIFGSWARLVLGIPPPGSCEHSTTAARHASPVVPQHRVGWCVLFGYARRCPGTSRKRPAGPRGPQGGPQARRQSMYTFYTRSVLIKKNYFYNNYTCSEIFVTSTLYAASF